MKFLSETERPRVYFVRDKEDEEKVDERRWILWRISRQRLAKHVPERCAVNENRRPLLDNRFGYVITSLSGTSQTWTGVMEPLEAVISISFSGISQYLRIIQ
jgi:hypothetical protein